MMSSKQLFKSAIEVIILTALLAATVYYFIPENVKLPAIAFAVGPSSQITGEEIAEYEAGIGLDATFLNGSCITIFRSDLDHEAYVGEFSALDLKSINVTLPGVSRIPQTYDKIVMRWVENKTVDTLMLNSEAVNMGTARVVGFLNGIMSLKSGEDSSEPGDWSDLPINATIFPTQDASYGTGYWKNYYEWRLDMDELKSIVGEGSVQVNITFNLDYSLILRYLIVNEGVKTYGDANLQWSGRWGTLQFIYDEHGLASVKFTFAAVKLIAAAT
jgi:hypothetical protein